MVLHVLMVCFTVKLKYSLNIQKAGSFTCEKKRLPAPVANTIRQGLILYVAIIGATIPAVVNPATVADPVLTLMIAAINQAKNSGCNESDVSGTINC